MNKHLNICLLLFLFDCKTNQPITQSKTIHEESKAIEFVDHSQDSLPPSLRRLVQSSNNRSFNSALIKNRRDSSQKIIINSTPPSLPTIQENSHSVIK